MGDAKTRPPGELILYETEDGQARIDCRFDGATLWLSQAQLAELFDRDVRTVNEHLQGIYEDAELEREATIRNFRIVRTEGKRGVSREVEHYSLEAVLAVGYRVRSKAGVRFRRWATDKLKEYIVKGFVLDDERLKRPEPNGYFEELLVRIQQIRTSERRFYQKITDIYATSIDYDPRDPRTKEFYATVQNKVHYATHGRTAAELVLERPDAAKPNMGLTTWEGARLRKSDVSIAKNYLSAEELRALSNLVEQYLVFATTQAERRIPMKMADWITKLEGFLSLNDREILRNAGKVSAELAQQHAEKQYERFRAVEDARFESDFDRAVKELPTKPPRPPKGKKQ